MREFAVNGNDGQIDWNRLLRNGKSMPPPKARTQSLAGELAGIRSALFNINIAVWEAVPFLRLWWCELGLFFLLFQPNFVSLFTVFFVTKFRANVLLLVQNK